MIGMSNLGEDLPHSLTDMWFVYATTTTRLRLSSRHTAQVCRVPTTTRYLDGQRPQLERQGQAEGQEGQAGADGERARLHTPSRGHEPVGEPRERGRVHARHRQDGVVRRHDPAATLQERTLPHRVASGRQALECVHSRQVARRRHRGFVVQGHATLQDALRGRERLHWRSADSGIAQVRHVSARELERRRSRSRLLEHLGRLAYHSVRAIRASGRCHRIPACRRHCALLSS